MVGKQVERERHWIDQGDEGEARSSSSSTGGAQVGGMGSGEPRIFRTDRNRSKSCTRSKGLTNRCNRYGWVAYLITDPNYIFLATITTGGVLLAALCSDDKSLRIGDLDKAVRVLLRCDPLMWVSIIEKTK
jgi:hypothetical protein